MAKRSGAELVVKALEDAGIAFTFGIPGTHNIELYDALSNSEKIQPILVTDEQSASFMADGVWRASGKLACVNVVPGAGLTHALSGIAEAYLDHVPLLVLGCGIRQDSGKSFQLHDIDQQKLLAPITKQVFRPQNGNEIVSMIHDACQIAREGAPGPVFVEIPANLYLLQNQFDENKLPLREAEPLPQASVHDLDRCLALLEKSKRPLLYLGFGCIGAIAELVPLAERLEALVTTTIQGKGIFPENHPLFVWPGFGKSAPADLQALVNGCDLTLAIGCRFGEVATGSYGLTPPQPLIHVDIDSKALSKNYETALSIQSDAKIFITALLKRLNQKPKKDEVRKQLQAVHSAIWTKWQNEKSKEGVSPQVFFESIQKIFGQETIFTVDSGNGTFLAMEHLRLENPRKFLGPIDYSCMGYAVPAAIGAKLAMPAFPVVALVGDGAFLMTGLEMLTASNMQLPVLFVVLRDRELSQIAQFQEVAMNRKTCTVLADYDLAALCRGLGLECLAIHQEAEVFDALQKAKDQLTMKKPLVLELAIDYATKSYFTRGVIKTNFNRLPLGDRLRMLTRAVTRKVSG